ncbi:hypothetical protein [Streptomyces yanii]|uniref:hypothetical protein n=1 Tax=Streptomyces yanii TaxID=78510 RepID=UPI0031E99BF2
MVPPEAEQLLLEATSTLDNRSSWRAAADGLVALTASVDSAGPLLEALGQLITGPRPRPRTPPGRGGRPGRPARQRISHLVARLATRAVATGGKGPRAAALRASELLGGAADFLPAGTHLFAKALDLDAEPAQLLAALQRLEALHTGRPVLAAVRQRPSATGSTPPVALETPLVLLCAVERLTANAGCAGGLFAVALTQALGARTGWTQDWRTQLRALRRHPHPDVRETALALTTAVE